MESIDQMVRQAALMRASDVHIAPGVPLRFRVDGQIVDIGDAPLTAKDCRDCARQITGDRYVQVETIGELDLARTYADGSRCRINVYRCSGVPVIALRMLSDHIPAMEELGLPPAVMEFPAYRKGIVLITGETGSGKSTTLASVIDRINHTRREHIITLEDPIEYLYTPDLCSIDQREIGTDTASYAEGLRASLREDPDVILIGEMRDLDTIETAITAAETGHLVLGTLHTGTAADSIDRMVDAFPAGRQRQIRLQLSQTLKAVVSQQLLVRREGKGRVVACEVMVVNAAIRNLIREAKTPQIENTLATSAKEGSVTMDNMLARMVQAGGITRETAVQAGRDQEYIRRLVH